VGRHALPLVLFIRILPYDVVSLAALLLPAALGGRGGEAADLAQLPLVLAVPPGPLAVGATCVDLDVRGVEIPHL
jgi:hypothetical protein